MYKEHTQRIHQHQQYQKRQVRPWQRQHRRSTRGRSRGVSRFELDCAAAVAVRQAAFRDREGRARSDEAAFGVDRQQLEAAIAEALRAARDRRDDACAAFVALRESEEMSGVGEAAWVVWE